MSRPYMMHSMKRIYLDHAAATPIDPGVLRVVSETLKKFPGNPSALHHEGVAARAVLERARLSVGEVLLTHPDEIVFTSGATEANNMAIMGVVQTARRSGIKNPHVIISAIEHPSVLRVARAFEVFGVRVERLAVNSDGIVDTKELRKLITPETVLVSVMYVNNEVGATQPIREIAKEVRHARKIHNSLYPLFHTDAAQAAPYCNLNVLQLGVDLMTLSSGKVYGPRGIGALFVRRGVPVTPLMYGGEHESGRRPGTESPALALGFAHALVYAETIKEKESKRLTKLRDALARQVLKKIPGSSLNGNPELSAPHIVNISIPDIESETLVLYLDAAGIAVSGRSACTSSSTEVSHVILALGKAGEREAGALRFSLGRATQAADITRVVKELERVTKLLKK